MTSFFPSRAPTHHSFTFNLQFLYETKHKVLWDFPFSILRFGREKDGNRGKLIASNPVFFCYKEFKKFALCKSVSQSEDTFIVYSEPIKNGDVKITFS